MQRISSIIFFLLLSFAFSYHSYPFGRNAFLNHTPLLRIDSQCPYIVNEGETLYLKLIGEDEDPEDLLTYTIVSGCENAHLNNLTGDFSWATNFDDAGNYEITLRVTDTTGLFTEIKISVEVININRPPEFTFVLPPGHVVQARNNNNQIFFQFLYMASDPDGDELFFSLESKIEGCSITSNGVLQFSPHLIQTHNYYVITVVVSDGELSDTTNGKIYIENILVDLEDNLVDIELKNSYQLFQNFPNPFNPTTNIRFTLPEESFVKLRVFNMLGEEIGLLVNQTLPAGIHSYDFNGSDLSSGIYIYRIETAPSSLGLAVEPRRATSSGEGFVSMKKMLLIK